MEKKWGTGIPSYQESDVMSKADLYKLAVDYVAEYEEKNQKLFCFSKDYDRRTGVSITGRVENDIVYIMVRATLAPNQIKMTEFERHALIAKSFLYGQSCYFANVSLGSMDDARRDASLALKDDEYYIYYKGMEYVPRANYDQRMIMELQALEELGGGYYIKNVDNFKKLLADDVEVLTLEKNRISGMDEAASYFAAEFEELKKKSVKTDYYLCKADGACAVYLEFVVKGMTNGMIAKCQIDDDGLITKLTLESPLAYTISFK